MSTRSKIAHSVALRSMVIAGALASLALADAAYAQCSDIGYRIWQPGGRETIYNYGDTIRLERGAEAHLYIHHRSRSRHPYSTTAEIGYPRAVGQRASYDADVLRLRAQAADDRAAGRLIFEARQPGRTHLGYRISDVSSAGVFNQMPAACRTGTVAIEVPGPVNRPRPNPTPNPGPGNNARAAARDLATAIQASFMPWVRPEVGEREIGRVLSSGRAGLVEQAGSILRSSTFRDDSYFETVEADRELRAIAERDGDVAPERVAEALMHQIYDELYGGVRPYGRLHRANVEDLLGCVGEESRAGLARCDALAERLLSNETFQKRYRDALDAIRR